MKFPFERLSDEDETVRKRDGKKVRGIERSTFLIDEKVVALEWRGMQVPGHVQEVLSFAKAL